MQPIQDVKTAEVYFHSTERRIELATMKREARSKCENSVMPQGALTNTVLVLTVINAHQKQ